MLARGDSRIFSASSRGRLATVLGGGAGREVTPLGVFEVGKKFCGNGLARGSDFGWYEAILRSSINKGKENTNKTEKAA